MHISVLILCIIVSWLAISVLSYLIFKSSRKTTVNIASVIIDAIFATLMAYLAVIYDGWITWNVNLPLVSLYIVFSAYMIGNAIWLLKCIYDRRKDKETDGRLKILLSLLFTIIITIYGMLNMANIVESEHTLYSDKLASNHTFVAVSDLHAGSAQSMDTIREAFENIKEYSPEFILLVGDITDEFTTGEILKETYEIIGDTGIPTYFVYGNHDRQPKTAESGEAKYTEIDLEKVLDDNGIIILKDSIAEIGEDITLLGREVAYDEKRLPVDKLPEIEEGRYKITADHYPFEIDDIIATEADLQISGHSHAGQYFPLEQVVQFAGYDSFGEYSYGKTTLIVSSGAGGWYAPFRTSRHCCFEVVHLMKNDNHAH